MRASTLSDECLGAAQSSASAISPEVGDLGTLGMLYEALMQHGCVLLCAQVFPLARLVSW